MIRFERKRLSQRGAVNDFPYLGEDPILARQIMETMNRLPTEIQTFVSKRCTIVSVGRTCYGIVCPGKYGSHPADKPSRNNWLIVLAEDLLEEHAEGIIAHEIACAWLGHNPIAFRFEDRESLVGEITRQWGFSGYGADAEH